MLELAGRPGRVFFCNSGAEANEAAFKISRLTGRPEVVTAEGSFHGRTMGALALTGQPGKAEAFAPLPGGVRYVAYGDSAALNGVVRRPPLAAPAARPGEEGRPAARRPAG